MGAGKSKSKRSGNRGVDRKAPAGQGFFKDLRAMKARIAALETKVYMQEVQIRTLLDAVLVKEAPADEAVGELPQDRAGALSGID